MNKAAGSKAAYRGMGSIDFFAVARSVLLVGRVEGEPNIRAIVQIKNNLAAFGHSKVFRLSEEGFQWLGDYEITADEVIVGNEQNLGGIMHKVFGVKENEIYFDRKGAYIIPIKENKIAVVQTPKGYFLIGGGLENGESDKEGIKRECLEETGYSVLVKNKVCSAETFYFAPQIGFFHPIQVYYSGDLLDMVQMPKENDHKLVWVKYDTIIGNMYLEMQGWAINQIWNSI